MLLFFSYLHYRCYWFLVTKTINNRLILVYDTAVEKKKFLGRDRPYTIHTDRK